jgi:general secretion pathway protein J
MPAKNTFGFTLLEILISLFIFTILSIMMAGALHSVINVQSGAERSALRLREMQMVLIRMSRDVEQTVNRPVKTANDQDASAFYGTTRGFAFTHSGMAGASTQNQVLERAQYIWGKNGLYRMAWDVLDQAEKSPKPSQRLLLDTVTDAYFEYMDDKKKFHKDWPVNGVSNQPLPRAVRINLTVKDWGIIKQTYVIPAQNPAPIVGAAPGATQGATPGSAPETTPGPPPRELPVAS